MNLPHPRVLIVEDDPELLLLLRSNLEAAGCDTSLAADGITALRRIEAESPDAVVVDLMLPGLDGWSILAELRDMAEPPAAIVCSARSNPEDRRRAFEWGARSYVQKPFEIEELVGAVLQAVGQPGELAPTRTKPLPLGNAELA
jgi:two-component system OmpR family response regulator